MNVSVVGMAKHVAVNRALEAVTDAMGGRKMLYGHNFYSKGEFW